MAAIGWIATGLTEADIYFSTRAGAIILWSGLTDAQKTAALTTAYNRIRFSRQVSIPANPTAAQLLLLVYAQEEYALHFVVLDEGGIRREAVQGQGVKSAGIVKETYLDPDKSPGLPTNIMEILDDFKTQKPFYSIETYRDEDINAAYDTHFDT
jgi:hypothetical protein